ncbi:MAG: AMP-binding protein [Microthrixaceae bacterium]
MAKSTRLRPEILPAELNVELHGDEAALITNHLRWSGEELAYRADEVVDRLGPDRRLVVVSMANDVGSLVAYLGARRGGHAVLLVDPDRISSAVDTWDPDVILGGDGQGWRCDRLRNTSQHDLHPELALLLSTSGSTGSPKCVRLSRSSLTSNALAIAEYMGLSGDDRAITSLPLHYCYGLSVLHSHLAVGAAIVVSDTSVVDQCFWTAVADHSVTSIAAVPYMLDLIDRVGVDRLCAPSLRRLTVAGGRTSPATVERYAELGEKVGWDLFVMYGQTEATARMAYLPPALARTNPKSIGIAVPGGQLDLAPVDGLETPAEVGELVYRGRNVMMGYATSTADLGRGAELDELRTGDLARRTPEGLFEIVGRKGRMAKLFGLRIDLDHLEQVLDQHGAPSWCVESSGGLAVCTTATADLVTRIVAQNVGLPPTTLAVSLVDELPRLANAKPDRSALTATQAKTSGPGSISPGAGDGVQAVMSEVLRRDDLSPEDSFVTLGGDSLSYVEVSLTLEGLLGELPANWHLMPIAELERLAERGRDAVSGRSRARWRHVETNLVLRAASILLIVVSHVGIFKIRGGAHLLLAIAGFNFARFLLWPDRMTLRTDTVRSIARIAIPSVIWLGVLNVVSTGYSWSSVALLNSYLGPPRWTPSWRYWFIEALVASLIVAALVTSVPAVRRWERRMPVLVPALLLPISLIPRYDLVTIGATPEPLLAPHRVAWFFVLGWLIARAESTAWRVVTSAVVLTVVPGFFGDSGRDLVVVLGLLVLIWRPSIRVPRCTTRAIGLLAGASLYIYLTHFQVYIPLERRGVPEWLAVFASIAAGVAIWRLVEPGVERLVSGRPLRIKGGQPRGNEFSGVTD